MVEYGVFFIVQKKKMVGTVGHAYIFIFFREKIKMNL
jgi:hypothetical protein